MNAQLIEKKIGVLIWFSQFKTIIWSSRSHTRGVLTVFQLIWSLTIISKFSTYFSFPDFSDLSLSADPVGPPRAGNHPAEHCMSGGRIEPVQPLVAPHPQLLPLPPRRQLRRKLGCLLSSRLKVPSRMSENGENDCEQVSLDETLFMNSNQGLISSSTFWRKCARKYSSVTFSFTNKITHSFTFTPN